MPYAATVLKVTRLITHQFPRERSKGERIRNVTLWPEPYSVVSRESANTAAYQA